MSEGCSDRLCPCSCAAAASYTLENLEKVLSNTCIHVSFIEGKEPPVVCFTCCTQYIWFNTCLLCPIQTAMTPRPITQSPQHWPAQAELSTVISSLASRRRDPTSSALPLVMDKTHEVSDVKYQFQTNNYFAWEFEMCSSWQHPFKFV